MRRHMRTGLALFFFLSMVIVARGQEAPALDRAGNSVSIVLNDSTQAITIEYHKGAEWVPLKLQAGKDARVPGDRVRAATTRQDKATISVDLPVEAGKKYRLFWNAQLGIWDFGPAA